MQPYLVDIQAPRYYEADQRIRNYSISFVKLEQGQNFLPTSNNTIPIHGKIS